MQYPPAGGDDDDARRATREEPFVDALQNTNDTHMVQRDGRTWGTIINLT